MVRTETIIVTPGSFTGMNRVSGFMRNLPKNLKKYSKQISMEIAKDLQRGMRTRVPKDTGALWRSINVKSQKGNRIVISVDSPYAQALEFGFTPHIIPTEYMERHRAGMGQSGKNSVGNPKGYIVSRWKGKQFVRPSIISTNKRLPRLTERAINKAISRS